MNYDKLITTLTEGGTICYPRCLYTETRIRQYARRNGYKVVDSGIATYRTMRFLDPSNNPNIKIS